MDSFLKSVKKSTHVISTLNPSEKDRVLHLMANALRENSSHILRENQKDMEAGKKSGLSYAPLERLFLNEAGVEAMAKAIDEIASLKEPVGRILDGWVVPSGLRIEKVSVPIGVIAIIYESRPNVTSDTAALCFKSGNTCVLKGGKEAHYSNSIIAKILQQVLIDNKLPKDIISLIPDETREGVARLIKMDRYIDLVIPRGGAGLIKYISENSTVPVVKHDKGLCHTYIDSDADIEKAITVTLNAKCRRVGICGALETLLVHKSIAKNILPKLQTEFGKLKTKLIGCEKTKEILAVELASEEDYKTEYLDNILTIKIVKNTKEAIEHINRYGSGHSDAIITENYTTAEEFLNSVDSACVYLNASTQFTDGGEFGFGAEVGISTNKLHARGPMGINELTTYKFKIYGKGNARA